MRFPTGRRNVELHNHFDGAVRATTLFEEAKRRGIRLPCETSDELAEMLHLKKSGPLNEFLQNFNIILPILAGDRETLSRCAKEFLEDCANKSDACYTEVRFAPHLLTSDRLDAVAVTRVLLEALYSASREHGVQFGVILCNLVDRPDLAEDIFRLALQFRAHGVVGIDLAGDEAIWSGKPINAEVVKCYKQAKVHDIHRTVHAGEAGTWWNVQYAIEHLHAERIGHGYHLLDNEELYTEIVKTGIHFELCPTSSLLTGGVPDCKAKHQHPLNRFAADGASYSVSTDCPLLTGRWLRDELAFCVRDLGWPVGEISRCRVNAARAAFIDNEEDRAALIAHVAGSGDDNRVNTTHGLGETGQADA